VAASDADQPRGTGAIGPEEAEFAIAHLEELSPDLRGCAILDANGATLAASGPAERWTAAAAGFLKAADEAAGEPIEHVHVGTEDGEAFAVRHDGLAMVAVTERFTLASLVLFDMRTILRDLTGGGAVVDRRASP
jgi:hypothetical protein